MENKDDIISSVNSSSSPRSKISDLLPSDILEEIGVPKIHKNPKISISSSNLKYASLNDDEINEKYLMNHTNGSSKFIYHSNLNAMNVMNNLNNNNNHSYIEFFGKINNYPKLRHNNPSSSNQIMIMNNNQNSNHIKNNNIFNDSLFYFNNQHPNNNIDEGKIKRVNSYKSYIPQRIDFLDIFPQNINNNINIYNSPQRNHFTNNKNYYDMYWQNINNNQIYRKYPNSHSNSSQNLTQSKLPIQIPKSRFNHRGSSNQISVQNNKILKDEQIENQNKNNINQNTQINIASPSTLIDSQIDNIFSQYELLNPNQSNLTFLLEKIGSNVFIQIIKTHKGSLYLQKILSNNPPNQNEIEIIILIICMNIQDIICDYYGNYFLQKFLPYCSLNHRLLLYKYIKPNFIKIANDICGNHSLQCLILLQNSKEEENIIKECIENNLFFLSTTPNSSHVIQKVIKAVKENEREYINNFIISNLMDLSLDPNGICIVKEFINENKSEFYAMSIISIFEVEMNKLTFSQFGNFGIQEIIKKYGENYCGKIINKFIERIIVFSMSKFSSNVVDFMIEYLSKNNFRKFYNVLNKIFIDEGNFDEMIKNKYATYVIENSLSLINKIDLEFFNNIYKDDDNNSNNSLSDDNNDKISFEEFNQLKNKIYSIILNNPIAKEKKKLMKLIKV